MHISVEVIYDCTFHTLFSRCTILLQARLNEQKKRACDVLGNRENRVWEVGIYGNGWKIEVLYEVQQNCDNQFFRDVKNKIFFT